MAPSLSLSNSGAPPSSGASPPPPATRERKETLLDKLRKKTSRPLPDALSSDESELEDSPQPSIGHSVNYKDEKLEALNQKIKDLQTKNTEKHIENTKLPRQR